MSPKRARFVQEYLVDGNGTAAAIRAGYAPASAHVRAARLMKDKRVAEAIREGQAETRHALKIDRERVIADLQRAYDLAKAKSEPMGMVAATREIGRLCGLYAPMQHAVAVTASEVATAMYERLSDAELRKLIVQEA